MFSKETKPTNFKDAETVIGPSIKVKGNFNGKGDIVIKGSLEGSLKTQANLFVGDKAKVIANVKAKEANINGEIQGNVEVEKTLTLGATAKIFGDIKCEQISVEQGAVINGKCQIIQETGNKKRDEEEEEEDEEEKEEENEKTEKE